jgi:hypothetical protein
MAECLKLRESVCFCRILRKLMKGTDCQRDKCGAFWWVSEGDPTERTEGEKARYGWVSGGGER